MLIQRLYDLTFSRHFASSSSLFLSFCVFIALLFLFLAFFHYYSRLSILLTICLTIPLILPLFLPFDLNLQVAILSRRFNRFNFCMGMPISKLDQVSSVTFLLVDDIACRVLCSLLIAFICSFARSFWTGRQ